MVGQSVTWNRFVPAEEKSEYAINRYGTESRRLYEVLNGQLESSKGDFLLGDQLTIADIANFTWVRAVAMAKVPGRLEGLPHLDRWLKDLKARPAFNRGLMNGFPDTDAGKLAAYNYANDIAGSKEAKQAKFKNGAAFLHGAEKSKARL